MYLYVSIAVVLIILAVVIFNLNRKVSKLENANMYVTPHWSSSYRKKARSKLFLNYIQKIIFAFKTSKPFPNRNMDQKLEEFILNKTVSKLNKEIIDSMELSGKFYISKEVVFNDIYQETNLPSFLEDKFKPHAIKTVKKVKEVYEKAGYIVEINIASTGVTYTISYKL